MSARLFYVCNTDCVKVLNEKIYISFKKYKNNERNHIFFRNVNQCQSLAAGDLILDETLDTAVGDGCWESKEQ